ncbi:Proclotting enzyme [Amphibalanus amphitrite]|uniref:limulus clotting factor C n=1 Tax=Amphibalanus amphitrite TaxID=1232801 RepID=A0A6A4WEX4_AMPAM|nr:Proclotting enzyme [Amphibalanus amphitrite]
MAARSPPAHSDDSSETARSRDGTDGEQIQMPVRLRHTNEVAYAIIDGRVTQVQVATAADLAAAAAGADMENDEVPADVDDELNEEENDADEDSMENVQQELGRWPWVALLEERLDGQRRWNCGGTLISARTVLTAAHCAVGRQPSDLTVRLGEHDLSRTNDGRHVDVSVARITIHPGYVGKQNDIALLQLSRPVTFSRRIQPVCLPAVDASHTGKTADLAGWGRTEFNGQASDVLQEARLRVVNVSRCEQAYEQLLTFDRDFPGGFQGTKLCASSADGTPKDACQGHSGVPLVYRTTGIERRYQVIGVVSTGLGCGNPKYPTIYTKVSKYIAWIFNNSS